MPCPRCGREPAAEARFCPHCGQPLGAEAPTVAAPPAAGSDRPPSSSGGWLTSSDSISHGRFPPGAVLDGRYRIIGLLGRGGMGEVYRADDLRLGQPVGLKFLPDRVAADAVRLSQFHNEVRTARQVSHPNICRVYDIGEADGHLFLSMEFVAGEDLATSIRRIGRFPEDKATDIARQLCAGLAAAHERGVIHRDLKPANVMLDDAGRVRVMDFGLATAGAVDDVRVGTPAYMAPEQLQGREVTQRSDIYALGLVLYELFTGKRAFPATTLNELIDQHQSGPLTAPREIVSTIDPATERAILRCLDPDPRRRPSSALAVSAALPGGDPLAAALAAGETPSPEMVAAAGEGAGIGRRYAAPVLAAAIAGIGVVYALALRVSMLEHVRPELTGEVLAQKARDVVRQLGYPNRAYDEAYSFEWDDGLIGHVRSAAAARPWTPGVERPSPLIFWYRRSPQAMTGLQFHHDLLTPGIVTPGDPAPIESGMVQVTLDQHGWLRAFEAIPPQVQKAPADVPAVNWVSLLALAGLETATLESAAPEWHWLAAADTRAAWTGTWPGTSEPLRVEAAALYGRPVAFVLVGPWTEPWRAAPAEDGGDIGVLIIFAMALAVLAGGSVLARRNLREGRGDRAGALTLGGAAVAWLWVLWLCQVHVSLSLGLLGVFLIAVCTTAFYGLLFWAVYLALEPLVRRYWPQTLVSWTTILRGRARDPIVGRDVLFGVALGVSIALLIASTMAASGTPLWPSAALLQGVRSSMGQIVMHLFYAVRSGLFFFFLLFLLRVALRNPWVAALLFASIFSLLDALDGTSPMLSAATTFAYSAMLAGAVIRWGLTTLTMGLFVADLLLNGAVTTDPSAWFVGATAFVLAIPLALALWGYYVGARQVSVVSPRGLIG